MKTSARNSSPTEPTPPAGYIPVLHPDPTIEELDEWVVALGGRELSKEEFSKIVAEVRWHDVPGERIDPERGVCAAPPEWADQNA